MAMSWFNRPGAIEPQQQRRRRKKNDTPGKSSQKTWTAKKKSVERKFLLQTFVVLLGSIVTSSLSGVLKTRKFTLHASSLRATLTPSISGILGRRKPEKSISRAFWLGCKKTTTITPDVDVLSPKTLTYLTSKGKKLLPSGSLT